MAQSSDKWGVVEGVRVKAAGRAPVRFYDRPTHTITIQMGPARVVHIGTEVVRPTGTAGQSGTTATAYGSKAATHSPVGDLLFGAGYTLVFNGANQLMDRDGAIAQAWTTDMVAVSTDFNQAFAGALNVRRRASKTG